MRLPSIHGYGWYEEHNLRTISVYALIVAVRADCTRPRTLNTHSCQDYFNPTAMVYEA
jgi:hypothetical protein